MLADGDIALAALLSVHNLAMNGGLLHSVENHSQDQIERAIAGYRYFGLDDAAAVVESIARRGDSHRPRCRRRRGGAAGG